MFENVLGLKPGVLFGKNIQVNVKIMEYRLEKGGFYVGERHREGKDELEGIKAVGLYENFFSIFFRLALAPKTKVAPPRVCAKETRKIVTMAPLSSKLLV